MWEPMWDELYTVIEMDEAFREVGEFGPLQKKLLIWYGMYCLVSVSYMLQVTFVGRTPAWECFEPGDIKHSNGLSTCQLFEAGKCKPVYSNEFTSIVSEVSLCTVLL